MNACNPVVQDLPDRGGAALDTASGTPTLPATIRDRRQTHSRAEPLLNLEAMLGADIWAKSQDLSVAVPGLVVFSHHVIQ